MFTLKKVNSLRSHSQKYVSGDNRKKYINLTNDLKYKNFSKHWNSVCQVLFSIIQCLLYGNHSSTTQKTNSICIYA